jgi:hypothetical protein
MMTTLPSLVLVVLRKYGRILVLNLSNRIVIHQHLSKLKMHQHHPLVILMIEQSPDEWKSSMHKVQLGSTSRLLASINLSEPDA